MTIARKRTTLRKNTQAKRTRLAAVVGIGASAGGLEALEELFSHLASDTDMAFVVVQHLSSDHESLMGQLLAKYTGMSIANIDDGMPLEPNHIYLNRPDKEVAIVQRTLQLIEPTEKHGLRKPIDYFLRSLAKDIGERAVGVILSGSGSDGTLGMEEVMRVGGLTLAQDEPTAKYSSMPQSAVASGCVDYELPPEAMAELLARYARDPASVRHLQSLEPEKVTLALQKILHLVREVSGHDFSRYKRSTLLRRIERRMQAHAVEDLDAYVRYLQRRRGELETLFKEFLIPVTRFFRDAEAFETLRLRVIPALLHESEEKSTVRVWTVACSTGEEAYSVAMLFKEAVETRGDGDTRVQIFATDISPDAMEKGRAGLYPDSIEEDVSSARLKRFFLKTPRGYQVRDELRDMVIFSIQDVLVDPPFSRTDLILCRNLLIYLENDLHRKVLLTFHYSLRPGGYLFLGTSESIGASSDLFSLADKEWKVFRRKGLSTNSAREVVHTVLRDQGTRPVSMARRAPANLRDFIDKLLVDRYAPPCVIVDEDFDVVRYSGKTDRYLQVPEGEPSHNLFRLLRPGLTVELRKALGKAAEQERDVTVTGAQMRTEDGYAAIDLSVRPLLHPEGLRGKMMIVFQEGQQRTTPAQPEAAQRRTPALKGAPEIENEAEQRVAELEWELEVTRQRLHDVIQELESAYMEQRTTNEELQSINEELQSTNEELQTANEEQQSTNEEMLTINAELQRKIEELSGLNDDMENLLSSTNIATVFLDRGLNIRRFTPTVKELVPLLETDVGRPLKDFHTNLEYPRLLDDISKVLETLQPKEVEVCRREGSWYLIRILPYLTQAGVVDGIVLTFVHVSEKKRNEVELKRLARNLEREVAKRTAKLEQTVRELRENEARLAEAERVAGLGHWDWDVASDQLYWSEQIYRIFGFSLQEFGGTYDAFFDAVHPDDRAMVQAAVDAALYQKQAYSIDHRIVLADGTERVVHEQARVSFDDAGAPIRMFGTLQDVTERKSLERRLQAEHDRVFSILEAMTDGVYVVNKDYDIEYVNPVIKQEFGSPSGQKCYAYFHDKTEPCEWCTNDQIFAGKSVRWEWESKKNNKTYELFDTPLRRPDGSVSKLEFFHDITAHKWAEAALRESEQKFRSIISKTSEAFWMLDRDLKTLEVNDALCGMLDYSAEEMRGKSPFKFADRGNGEALRDNAAQLAESTHSSFRVTLKTKKGDDVPTIFNATTVRNETGEPLYAFAFVTDLRSGNAAAKQNGTRDGNSKGAT